MKGINLLICLFSVVIFTAYAGVNNNPQFSDFPVTVSTGHFVSKMDVSVEQEHHTDKWKQYIQKELIKPVNFSGHYRIIMSRNGELPQDCGNDGWVCGWIVDKLTGKIISELPEFNGNTKYYSTIDNGTPSPDSFDVEHHSNSSMIWVSGQNAPAKGKQGEAKCANTAYNFKDNEFIKLVSSRCEVDVGDDANADPYLP
ncbi:hypothetical protein EC843_101898 [Buttiauxella sp. JUb87]|uniref:hypothetical protein n=1 Tax=Buttiauxella sp. JUb87 TaxID=2485129 RepID=UPI00105C05E7|nr:hypothetical protein [Buttiauxella sp. JUb87]TDN54840.1 hypothetical protein EC843_101898 [Buttiauxella sp. JUb87]